MQAAAHRHSHATLIRRAVETPDERDCQYDRISASACSTRKTARRCSNRLWRMKRRFSSRILRCANKPTAISVGFAQPSADARQARFADGRPAPIRVPIGMCRRRTGPNAPVILVGHQPELVHPGVWFKNFLLSELAHRTRPMPSIC